MRKCLLILIVLSLAACKSPEQRSAEAVAKRNPLDMANEDAQVVVIKKVDKKPQYPKVPTQDANTAPFVSGKNSKVYHVRGCEYAGKLESPVGFATWDDAERSGRIPCQFCKPHDSSGSPK